MKLDLTKDEARELLWSDSDEYDVVRNEVIGNRRWSIDHEIVIKRMSDGLHFRDNYSVGATEMQDESPWEYSEPNFVQVFPKEITTVEYVTKEQL